MGKSHADLVHMLRLMGADSQGGESKASLINRILLFQKQEWKQEVKKKPDPIKPVTPKDLEKILMPYILRGLNLKIKDNCWYISIKDGKAWRQDSGSMLVPAFVIERCAKYLMPKGV